MNTCHYRHGTLGNGLHRGLHSRRRMGLLACLGVFSCFCAAQAETALTLDRLMLPPGSAQVSLGQRLHLFGMPVDIRVIDIPDSVDHVARLLGERHAGLTDVAVYPGTVMLSGQIDGQFAVIMLEPAGPRQTRGSVSVLPEAHAASFPTSKPVVEGSMSLINHVWLPSTARLRLQLEQDEADGGHILEQIWTTALPIAAARRYVYENLSKRNWKLKAEASMMSRWSCAQHTLQLTLVPVDHGSGLLLQRHEGVKPCPEC